MRVRRKPSRLILYLTQRLPLFPFPLSLPIPFPLFSSCFSQIGLLYSRIENVALTVTKRFYAS